MKRFICVLCITLLLFSVLNLAGCGMDGTYKITKINVGEKAIDPAELGYGDAALEIRGDKANLTGIEGSTGTLTIDEKAKTMSDGATSIPYTTDGDTVTLNMLPIGFDYKMVFQKQ